MKQFKGRMIVLAIALLAFSAIAAAGPDDSTARYRIVNLSMQTFRQSLKSDIPGVVEGTILDVVVFKKIYPNLDFDVIADRVNNIAELSKVPVICYKAHLASIYLAHPAQFEIVPNTDPEKQDDVFTQIAHQLQKQLTASGIASTMSVK